MLPDKRLADPRISIAEENSLIAFICPTNFAPSFEFFSLHEPFPNTPDTALLCRNAVSLDPGAITRLGAVTDHRRRYSCSTYY